MLSRGGGNRGGSDAELVVQGLVVSAAAECSTPTLRPASPMIFSQPLLTPASTLTRARMPGAAPFG
jgi:hypothetical protein